MINCFQLCSIWSYIKYSNKRRKWQYKNAYGEMQQNKHLMKGSEGRNVFSYILFLKNKVSQFKRPIQIRNRKTQDVQSCNHSEPGAAMHFYLILFMASHEKTYKPLNIFLPHFTPLHTKEYTSTANLFPEI